MPVDDFTRLFAEAIVGGLGLGLTIQFFRWMRP